MAEDKRDRSWTNRVVAFLVESGVKPLESLGKAIKHFGAIPVIFFLMGAAVVYGLALIWPLPGAATSDVQTVTLSGDIKTIDNEPLSRFRIAFRGPEFGPFDNGHFEMTGVPRAKHYDLIVWPYAGYTPVMMYAARSVYDDGPNGLKLRETLPNFPSRLGRVSGKITDQSGRPMVGEIDVAGSPTTIKADGTFEIMDIPLGQAGVIIKDAQGKSLYNGSVAIELNSSTPYSKAVGVPQ